MQQWSKRLKTLSVIIIALMILGALFAVFNQPAPPEGQPIAETAPTVEPLIDDDMGFISDIVNGLWGLINRLWNLLAFGGIALQLCCCCLIPFGVIALFINDTMR
jgi:hypothetical protein